jgi:hypothetical protein
MVDTDKIRKRKKKKEGGEGDKSIDKEDVKDKRGSKSKKSKNKTPKNKKSKGGDDDVKKLLFAIANMDMFSRTMSEHKGAGMGKQQRKVMDDVTSDMVSEVVNFMGVFDVTDISGKYGYDWKGILEHLTHNRDVKGSRYKTNSNDPSSKDIKKLLDCIANILLYAEGNVRRVEEMDNPNVRDTITKDVSEVIYNEYKKVISRCEVQRVAERHGYSWKDDVIKGVLEDQDLEELISRKG